MNEWIEKAVPSVGNTIIWHDDYERRKKSTWAIPLIIQHT